MRATSRESLRLCLLLDYVCMHIVHFADETQTRLHVYAVYVSSAFRSWKLHEEFKETWRCSGEEGPIHVEGLQTFTKLSAVHHAPHTMHTSHITHTHTHTSRTMHHAPHITRTPRSLTHLTSHERFHELVSTSLTHSLTATHSLVRSLTLLSSITSLLFMNGKLCMWGYPVL